MPITERCATPSAAGLDFPKISALAGRFLPFTQGYSRRELDGIRHVGKLTSSKTPAGVASAATSTVTGSMAPLVTKYLGSNAATAVFTGQPLLTGSCSSIYYEYAVITDGEAIVFPQQGCWANREQCCPFNFEENAVLTICPRDYASFTGPSSSYCCPSSVCWQRLFLAQTNLLPRRWDVWDTGIAGHTPCYTSLSTPVVPATTPTIPNLQVITGQVFARKFDLASTVTKTSPRRGLVVAVVVSSICVIMMVSLGYCVFTRRQRRDFGRQSSPASENTDATTTTTPAIPLTYPSQLERLERSRENHDIEPALEAGEALPQYQDNREAVELEAPLETQHPLNRLNPRNSNNNQGKSLI